MLYPNRELAEMIRTMSSGYILVKCGEKSILYYFHYDVEGGTLWGVGEPTFINNLFVLKQDSAYSWRVSTTERYRELVEGYSPNLDIKEIIKKNQSIKDRFKYYEQSKFLGGRGAILNRELQGQEQERLNIF